MMHARQMTSGAPLRLSARKVHKRRLASSAPIIDRVRIDWGRMPVKLVFSYGRVEVFPFIIVRLWSGDHCGIGEVLVPWKDFLDELLQQILGADVRRLDKLLPAEVFNDSSPDGNHHRILCEAVSMAMYDLLGHVAGLPLYALLGGAQQLQVPLMPCIFPRNSDEARSTAVRLCEQGYRFFKVKLAGDPDEDLARVQAIRSVISSDCLLQGDANCGYKTLDDAQRALAALGQAGLNIFEDPLQGDVDDYSTLTRRRQPNHARVMIDALARRTDSLLSALRNDACNVVGIHPDQPGSISQVLRHGALASTFNIPVVIGGTGYTAVGSAAYQHITAVLGGPAGELGGHIDHGMPRSLVRNPLRMRGGMVHIPDLPGIGVELDEQALGEYREGTREFA